MRRRYLLAAACLSLALAAVPQWAGAGKDARPAWAGRLVQVLPAGDLYIAEVAVRNRGTGPAHRVQVLVGGLALTKWLPAGPEVAVWPAGEERRFRVGPLDARTGALAPSFARAAAWATHIKVRWHEAGQRREQVLR